MWLLVAFRLVMGIEHAILGGIQPAVDSGKEHTRIPPMAPPTGECRGSPQATTRLHLRPLDMDWKSLGIQRARVRAMGSERR
jgi:hypothetical protein